MPDTSLQSKYRDRLERLIERATATGQPGVIKHAHTINEGFEMRGVHPGLEYWTNDLESWVEIEERLSKASR